MENCRTFELHPAAWTVAVLGFGSLLITACTTGGTGDRPVETDQALKASVQRLELRLDQMERELKDQRQSTGQADDKTPSGPIRSLTLRLGTNDDRLRLYWADGQRSDLICSQEGKGVWACG